MLAIAPALLEGYGLPAAAKPKIKVFRTPACGCCADWAKHLEDNGFEVTVTEVADIGPIRARYGIPEAMQSCHTAEVNGYAVEGHVPADVIHRFLREKRDVAGIAVPGMPIGSPGMEQAGEKETYRVYTFDASGKTQIYRPRARRRRIKR